jgi:hypothetical protein
MSDGWYKRVEATEQISQGDLIFDCPMLRWQPGSVSLSGEGEAEQLKGTQQGFRIDVIVMTQACDLEQGKVNSVVLCPHFSLDHYKELCWTQAKEGAAGAKNEKAWRKFCDEICKGFVWNLAMLNTGNVDDLKVSNRVVDFHQVYTAPREFLESVLKSRAQGRLRLLPPYREHLSQAFARFFMRVGLPSGVEKVWES